MIEALFNRLPCANKRNRDANKRKFTILAKEIGVFNAYLVWSDKY